MTEAQWLACDDPIKMLNSLYGRVSEHPGDHDRE
jgi:hypothetical protein